MPDGYYWVDDLLDRAVYSLLDPPIWLGVVREISADKEWILVEDRKGDKGWSDVNNVRFGGKTK
jgi:hypothetical protein